LREFFINLKNKNFKLKLLKCLNDESVELIKNASEEEQLNLLLILNCLGKYLIKLVVLIKSLLTQIL